MGRNKRTKEVVEEMRRKGSLPAINETVIEISRLTKKQSTSSADLAAVIMRDCGLTTNLLVTVNSAYYAPAFPIKTISAAVTFLGFEKVHVLALGLGIFKHTMDSLRKKNLLKLYATSYFSGILAMALARQYNYSEPEEIFVAGLLYRLPRMSLAYSFPKRFHSIEGLVNEEKMTYNQACLKVLKVRYDDICSEILKRYKLPGRVSTIFDPDARSKDDVISLIHEAANIATLLFGDMPGGKKVLSAIEERLKSLLKKQDFSFPDFVKKTCREDKNVTRFFNLNEDDVEMMVNLLIWGKVNPADVVANLAFGVALEKEEETMESPETLLGHFLTELSICRRQGGDINQILMLVQEALYRCLENAEIFAAFLSQKKDVLIGRFYAGSNLHVKAENFKIDVEKVNSQIIQCFSQQTASSWTVGRQPLHLPFSITRHLKLASAYIIPIVASSQTIGIYFVARTTKTPFTEREQAWIDLIVSNVEAGFVTSKK